MTVYKIGALSGSLLSCIAFFLSWGTVYSHISNPLVRGTVVDHYTGANAGPYGYIMLVIASICVLLSLGALISKSLFTHLKALMWISALGAIFVVFALLTHPKIGWPIGPDLAIAGFVCTSIFSMLHNRSLAKSEGNEAGTKDQLKTGDSA